MSEAEIIHCVKRDVAAYLRACEHLLRAREVPLTAHEREMILLYTRRVIEACL
jgi:hypothetical protein